jgi:hypothetical protein
LNDKKKTLILSEKMVKFFSKTPYITRKRADVGTVPLAGRVVVILTGDDVINAGEGEITNAQEGVTCKHTTLLDRIEWVLGRLGGTGG